MGEIKDIIQEQTESGWIVNIWKDNEATFLTLGNVTIDFPTEDFKQIVDVIKKAKL